MFERKTKKDAVIFSVVTAGEDPGTSSSRIQLIDKAVLVRAARRQSRALVSSLAGEMGKAEGQADLDICRGQQGMRIGQALQAPAAEAISEVSERGRRMAERCPEVGPVIDRMTSEMLDLLSQMPRVAMATYTARYFPIDRGRRYRSDER